MNNFGDRVVKRPIHIFISLVCLLCGASTFADDEGWKIEPFPIWHGHEEVVDSASFLYLSPNSQFFLMSSAPGIFDFVDIKTHEKIYSVQNLGLQLIQSTVDFSPDSRFVTLSDSKNSVLIDLKKKQHRSFEDLGGPADWLYSVKRLRLINSQEGKFGFGFVDLETLNPTNEPSETFVASMDDKFVIVKEGNAHRLQARMGERPPSIALPNLENAYSVEYSANGHWMAYANFEKKLCYLVNVQTFQKFEIPLKQNLGKIYFLPEVNKALILDGWVGAYSWDAPTYRTIDLQTGKEISHFVPEYPKHGDPFPEFFGDWILIKRNGPTKLDYQDINSLYDLKTGKEVYQFKSHENHSFRFVNQDWLYDPSSAVAYSLRDKNEIQISNELNIKTGSVAYIDKNRADVYLTSGKGVTKLNLPSQKMTLLPGTQPDGYFRWDESRIQGAGLEYPILIQNLPNEQIVVTDLKNHRILLHLDHVAQIYIERPATRYIGIRQDDANSSRDGFIIDLGEQKILEVQKPDTVKSLWEAMTHGGATSFRYHSGMRGVSKFIVQNFETLESETAESKDGLPQVLRIVNQLSPIASARTCFPFLKMDGPLPPAIDLLTPSQIPMTDLIDLTHAENLNDIPHIEFLPWRLLEVSPRDFERFVELHPDIAARSSEISIKDLDPTLKLNLKKALQSYALLLGDIDSNRHSPQAIKRLSALKPLLLDLPEREREDFFDHLAQTFADLAADTANFHGFFTSRLYKFTRAFVENEILGNRLSFSDLVVERVGKKLKLYEITTPPQNNSNQSDLVDSGFGFWTRLLTEINVPDLDQDGSQLDFEWQLDNSIYSASVSLRRLSSRSHGDRPDSFNTEEAWKDNSLTGLMVVGNNLSSSAKDLKKEYSDYFKLEGFEFGSDFTIESPTDYLQKIISSGELDYLIKEAHSDGDDRNLFRLASRLNAQVGTKTLSNGRQEKVIIAVPASAVSGSLISNNDFGSWIQEREMRGGSALTFFNTSCWSYHKAVHELEAANSPCLNVIPTEGVAYTFFNDPKNALRILIDSYRSGRTFDQTRELMRVDEHVIDGSGNRYLFPDERRFTELVTEVISDPVDVKVEMKKDGHSYTLDQVHR